MLENLLYLLILVLGFPAGLVLAKMCSDEIKAWRKRLIIISSICLILAVIISLLPSVIYSYKIPAIVGLFFIIITSLTIVWKTYPKVKLKKRQS
jgi:hypothetical protein